MPKKDKEKEVFGDKGSEKVIESMLEQQELKPELIEKLKLELDKIYKDKIQLFKTDYNKYAQTGRFFTSTKLRQIKKRDWVCFVDCEADILVIEKVVYSDGTTLQSKSYEYPVALTKTIEMKPSIISLKRRGIIIHLCIANTYALQIGNHVRNLANSVFLKSILKYKDGRKLSEKPLLQMIIAGAIFGLVGYFMLLQVFEKAILHFIGQFEIIPPTDT